MNRASELRILVLERVTGIEPALSAWESGPSAAFTCPELRSWLSVSAREIPVLTGVNGTLMARRSWTAPGRMTLRPSAFQAGHIPSWRGSCGSYALSPVTAVSRWLPPLLSPLLAAVDGRPTSCTSDAPCLVINRWFWAGGAPVLHNTRTTGERSLAERRCLCLRRQRVSCQDARSRRASGPGNVISLNMELTALPTGFDQLARLHSLILNGNQLTTLPPEIGDLAGLETLTLDGNQLTTSQLEIGPVWKLRKLRKLSLDGNQLTALPSKIGQLGDLQYLSLSHNWLTALPLGIADLLSLRELWVVGNRLTALPPGIGQLTNLQGLWLDGNQLTALPSEIGQLANLQTLTLDRNRLTALPPEIGQLANLQTLTLNGNKLTALPPEIGQLAKLDDLSLSRNRLTALPPEIARLTNLQGLWLTSNKLTRLPPEIADLLRNGMTLALGDNQLQEPIPELVDRGTSALAAYLRSLKREEAVAQYEAKVLLVGEGNVGKTSLVAALRNDSFVEDRSSTHGIEIQPLVLRHSGLKPCGRRVLSRGGAAITR